MADFDDAKVNSMEARIDAKFDAIQRTLSQISNQLGLRPIEAETSRQTPMVSFIEFPIFTGVDGDLKQWILWLEEFFVRERFTAMEKLNLAQSLLAGKAEAWFYRAQKILLFRSWEDLKNNLLLWFGDFANSTRLIVEQDQFLQEIRDEARIQRMKTTSIPVKDTIRETIAVVEETSAIVAGNLDESASEKKSITQNQVPVSSLEPSLSFSSKPVDVSASWPCAFVSNNPVHSQSGFASVKNLNNVHHVFDELSHRRHNCQQRKPLSLSPKSRMFKFKRRTLLSNWSQMDLHQVIDISIGANFGLVRKTSTFQCLRLQKQAHMSRVLYPMRMLHDPGGKQDEHSDDKFVTEVDIDNVAEVMNLIGDVKGQVAKNPVAFHSNVAAVTSISQSMFVCVREFARLLEVNCLWAECMMHTTTVISATLYSLFSCEVDTAENISSGLSQIRQVWEPGGVLSDHVLVDHVAAGSKGLASDGCVILGMHCAGFGSGKTELLATGQQMQRTDLFSELLKDSSNGGAESFPILNVVTEHSFLWLQKTSENYLLVSEFEIKKQMLGYKTRMFKYKSRFQEISLTDTQFLCEKVQRVSCLSLAAQFNSLAIIKAVLEQIIQGETSTKIIDNAASSSGSHAKSLLIEMGFCPTLVQEAIGENGEDLKLLLEILTKSTVTEEPSFHGLMEPKQEPDIESETASRRMTLLAMQFPENLVDLALDRLGKDMPHWERMSIWHRWRRKDCTRPVVAFYHCYFPSSSLRTSLFSGGKVLIRFFIVFNRIIGVRRECQLSKSSSQRKDSN